MTDPSPTSREVAAQALVTFLVTALFRPSRLPVWARRGWHATLGLGAGGSVWAALSRRSRTPLPARPRAALAAGMGGLVALGSVGGFVLDARLERTLVRRGTRHPRLWMGVGATVLSVAAPLVAERAKGTRTPSTTADPS